MKVVGKSGEVGSGVLGSPGTGGEIGFESGLEDFAGAMDEGFGGGNGDAKDIGDFLVAEFAFAAEGEGEALFFGEIGQGFVDLDHQFLVLRDEIGGRLGGIGMLAGGKVVAGFEAGFEGFGGMPAAASDFVEAEIAGDGEEEGAEAGLGFVATGGFPELDEDALGDVLGFVGIRKDPVDEMDDGLFPAVDEGGERVRIALANLEHQGGIFVGLSRRRHHVDATENRKSGQVAREAWVKWDEGGRILTLQRRPNVAAPDMGGVWKMKRLSGKWARR